MITIRNERTIFVDVDDTLVMHNQEHWDGINEVEVQCSLDSKDKIIVYPNNPMIRLVKEESARGSYIVVWSRGGFQWAGNVVIALGLIKYVDQVMTKPYAYFDDKDVSHWLKDRVYIDPKTTYKTIK